MLDLTCTCTTITSVDLAHYGVSRAKDRVSVDCGTLSHEFFPLRADPRVLLLLCYCLTSTVNS